mmetsp:Transcript_22026/g.68117  ORF Transcript_22026/g.68117 Transcript_22026/m.68117 type:complete len:242 (-) Transcript_22026:231-956(-)
MALREVHHVDVVTHARAVRRGVVRAEDGELLAPPHRNLLHEGHEVVGDAARVLADAARRVRANWVEVAQQHDRPLLVGDGHVAHYLLDEVFGAAVRVGGLHLAVLCGRHGVRLAVHGGAAAKHYVLAAMAPERNHKVERAHHVVAVVPQRLGHRLPHRLEPREVDARVELALLAHRVRGGHVQQVHLVKGQVLRLVARQLLDALHRHLARVVQVVQDVHLAAALQQQQHRVRAYVPRAARH